MKLVRMDGLPLLYIRSVVLRLVIVHNFRHPAAHFAILALDDENIAHRVASGIPFFEIMHLPVLGAPADIANGGVVWFFGHKIPVNPVL
jgi:hypothetical protein